MLQFQVSLTNSLTPTDNVGFTSAWLVLASCWATLVFPLGGAVISLRLSGTETVIVDYTGAPAPPGSLALPPPLAQLPRQVGLATSLLSGVGQPPPTDNISRCHPAWCISRLFCCRERWSNSLYCREGAQLELPSIIWFVVGQFTTHCNGGLLHTQIQYTSRGNGSLN